MPTCWFRKSKLSLRSGQNQSLPTQIPLQAQLTSKTVKIIRKSQYQPFREKHFQNSIGDTLRLAWSEDRHIYLQLLENDFKCDLIRSQIQYFQLERMIASKNFTGCAVILLLLLASTSALSLTHQYSVSDWVQGKTQILNACYKALPEDKNTLFEWPKTQPGQPHTLIITSCSNEPAKVIKRSCTYTLGADLQATGVDFHLGACSIIQNGAGCVDPVPNYLSRLASVTKLELLSDRYNFRQSANGPIQLVTQTKH